MKEGKNNEFFLEHLFMTSQNATNELVEKLRNHF